MSPALLCANLPGCVCGILTSHCPLSGSGHLVRTYAYIHLCACIPEVDVSSCSYLEILLVGFVLEGAFLEVIQDGLQLAQHHLYLVLVSTDIQDLWVL